MSDNLPNPNDPLLSQGTAQGTAKNAAQTGSQTNANEKTSCFAILSDEEAVNRLPTQCPAIAFFSTLLGGITKNPAFMSLPIDDHLAHRGDGVFETVKLYNGAPYLLKEHLQRLERSASGIGMDMPMPKVEVEAAVRATAAAAGGGTILIRILVSRGPGGFSVNPYESTGPQLYIAAYPAAPPFMATHPEGARVMTSSVPVKPDFLAQIKTCNYIQNAMMKKEAVDAEVDFSIGVNAAGMVSESFTENLCLVKDGEIIRPPCEGILAGTTMLRCLELASEQEIQIRGEPFSVDDGKAADEILIFGTTAEVTGVIEWDGSPIGTGQLGPMFATLSQTLKAELDAL